MEIKVNTEELNQASEKLKNAAISLVEHNQKVEVFSSSLDSLYNGQLAIEVNLKAAEVVGISTRLSVRMDELSDELSRRSSAFEEANSPILSGEGYLIPDGASGVNKISSFGNLIRLNTDQVGSILGMAGAAAGLTLFPSSNMLPIVSNKKLDALYQDQANLENQIASLKEKIQKQPSAEAINDQIASIHRLMAEIQKLRDADKAQAGNIFLQLLPTLPLALDKTGLPLRVISDDYDGNVASYEKMLSDLEGRAAKLEQQKKQLLEDTTRLKSLEQKHETYTAEIKRIERLQELARTEPSLISRVGPSVEYFPVDGELFIQGQNDGNAISPNDVTQGLIYDCYLIAPLGSLAEHHPDVIKNMVRDNQDGTYTVTLYEKGDGDPMKFIPKEVTVLSQFPADKNNHKIAYAQTGDLQDQKPEVWVSVIEKAVAKEKGSYAAIGNKGYPHEAMEMLTGKPSAVYRPNETSLDSLAKEVMNGHAVIAVTGSIIPAKFVPTHAYYVTAVDTVQKTVTVRNPYGWDKGALTLSESEYLHNLEYFSVNPVL